MSLPRHFIDPAAHEALFNALKAELTASIAALPTSTLVPGMIMPFSGTLGGSDGKRPINPHTDKADEGFALCDGGTYRAPGGPLITTPNLRNRFVLGAGGDYAAGTIGGATGHTHTATVGATTLTTAQIPSHTHSTAIPATNSTLEGSVEAFAWTSMKSTTNKSYASTATGSGGSHLHTAAVATAVESLPPYYALSYIMKL